MSTTSRPNPPAFPQPIAEGEYETLGPGMSLRDYFAAAALTGILILDTGQVLGPHQVARAAYGQADAMLRERTEP